MGKRSGATLIVFILLAVVLIGGAVFHVVRPDNAAVASSGASWSTVPRATCGAGDTTEQVQGQVTLSERFRPDGARAYNCNLQLVGQYTGEGSSFSSATFDNCAYYSTHAAEGYNNPALKRPGLAVIDVSDPKNPHPTDFLTTPASLRANESIVISKQRKILAAGGWDNNSFDLYDLSKGCAKPVLLSTGSLPRMNNHSGAFSPDGTLFYTSPWSGAMTPVSYASDPNRRAGDPPPSGMFIIDLKDPTAPHVLTTWIPTDPTWMTHAVRLDATGNRAYVALTRWLDDGLKSAARDMAGALIPQDKRQHSYNKNGLVILDISDFQSGKKNPSARVIGTLFWDDTHYGEYALPVTIGGHSYIVYNDLIGAIGAGSMGGAKDDVVPANACESGRPGHGIVRIIDVADEKKPRTVSKLMLEVAAPKNCASVMYDPARGYKYGVAACAVDDPADTRLMACGHLEAGLRVFDIRDPQRPREVAYYKPKSAGTRSTPAAPLFPTAIKEGQKPTSESSADQVIMPHFHGAGKSTEIWFNSTENGFQIVRFSDAFVSSNPGLFPDPGA